MLKAEYIYPNVKRICRTKNKKIADIEESLGLSRGYISRMGNGKKSMGIEKVLIISNVLDVPLDELLMPPPIHTNADVFREVFGIEPPLWRMDEHGINGVATTEWWNEPYTGVNYDAED